jgi:hypothetical protein
MFRFQPEWIVRFCAKPDGAANVDGLYGFNRYHDHWNGYDHGYHYGHWHDYGNNRIDDQHIFPALRVAWLPRI